LELDPEAEVMVFVGRCKFSLMSIEDSFQANHNAGSMQKGIDIIADVMPGILEEYPHVQL
jgi:hypothetical protein